LVELMVAVTTGMLVAGAAFLLAKVSLGSFQEDARVSAAQYNAVVAMNRLVNDIQRAGYMASPNIRTDPRRCGVAPPAWFADNFVGLRVFDGANGDFNGVAAYGTAPNDALPVEVTDPAINNRSPDRVRIFANFTSNELFRYKTINESTTEIHLEPASNAMQRVQKEALSPGAPTFCGLFPNGQLARLLDDKGQETYVQITACNDGFPASVRLTYQLLSGTSLPNDSSCGAVAGGWINPVSVVEYSVQQIMGPDFIAGAQDEGLDPSLGPVAEFDANDALSTGEGSRVDLIRREIVGDNIADIRQAELVAEFVADFKLQLRFQDPAAAPGVVSILPDSGFIKAAMPAPEFIRGAGVRLTTRARAPERSGMPAPPVDEGEPLTRFHVFPAAATNEQQLVHARVRTLSADVHLTNLSNR
jgi:hypothetical protein